MPGVSATLGLISRIGLAEHHSSSLAVSALPFYANLEALKVALPQCKAEVEALSGARKSQNAFGLPRCGRGIPAVVSGL